MFSVAEPAIPPGTVHSSVLMCFHSTLNHTDSFCAQQIKQASCRYYSCTCTPLPFPCTALCYVPACRLHRTVGIDLASDVGRSNSPSSVMIAALQRSVLSQARCRLQQAACVVINTVTASRCITEASVTSEDALYSQGASLNAYSGVIAALLGTNRGRQVA
jgi:hypothetical protein